MIGRRLIWLGRKRLEQARIRLEPLYLRLHMLHLEQLATQVIDNWDRGDLAASVRALGEHLAEIRTDRLRHESQIAFARERYAVPSDDTIEIDPEPLTSASHEGVWIHAWLWVDHDDVPPQGTAGDTPTSE